MILRGLESTKSFYLLATWERLSYSLLADILPLLNIQPPRTQETRTWLARTIEGLHEGHGKRVRNL